MPSNKTAFLAGIGASLEVKEAPYFAPGPGHVTIKNHAMAINPCDWIQQDTGLLIPTWPYILGCDVAGTVEEVGPDVQNLKEGDRVFAMSAAIHSTGSEGSIPQMQMTPGGGGFQLYSVVRAQTVSKLPSHISFEQGSVIPLGFLTAASALYLPSFLGLNYPSPGAPKKESYILVWGGSSSVGSSGIQLAINSGFNVLATCSAHNKSYCEALGAERALDYKSPSLVDDVVEYLNGKQVAGILDAIGQEGIVQNCIQMAKRCEGSAMVMTVNPGTAQHYQQAEVKVGSVVEQLKGQALEQLFGRFLPDALENGSFKAKPDPLIVGKGLESLQKGVDTVKASVSASKVVVTL